MQRNCILHRCYQ